MVPNLFPDGKFVGKEAYAAMLAQQNMTIDSSRADMKRQLMITRLRDIAMEGTVVTPAEIEAAIRKKNEKIKIEYVKLTADKYKAESQPTPEEMQDFFKANTASTGPGEEEPDDSDRRPGQDWSSRQRRPTPTCSALTSQNQEPVPHAGACEGAAHSAEDQGQARRPRRPKIKAKAEDLLKQVKRGADFGELAKEYSEDTGLGSGNGRRLYASRRTARWCRNSKTPRSR